MVDNDNPNTLTFSLFKELWPLGSSINAEQSHLQAAGTTTPKTTSHSALFMQSGTLSVNGDQLQTGKGIFLSSTDTLINNSCDSATALRFVISRHPINSTPINSKPINSKPVSSKPVIESKRLLSQTFITTLQHAIVRLDQVDFPPGAIAYKHTHPGAGIRYLVTGGLQLESDHDVQQIQAGDAWFEDKQSPVQATAINTAPSCFVRAMLLPMEFENKPTLSLINAEDSKKPRLQTNVRHVEQRVLIEHLH